MSLHETSPHLDVVIVGAGLSGVGAAYRLQTERPGTPYAILEMRERLGGTWDLFRYPGVRSDSDMYTLGYSFKPWSGEKSLADGASILDYIRETATDFGIDEHITYETKVVAADFDTAESRWRLTLEDTRTGETREMTCGFLYSCAGYYDYEQPHAPEFAGAETFAGEVVHPQFWPESLDYAGKKVVVIGSGATAVTLVPSMLEGDDAAAHVTMLQRTPTWISAVPSKDAKAELLKSVLPAGLAHQVIRTKNIAFNTAVYQFCKRRPAAARKLLTGMSAKILGDPQLVADHFTPTYNPWEQRLCAIPSGDLFVSIKKGEASVVTDTIERFVPEGILLTSGETLEADIIVTATGLRLKAFGGIEPHVDGERVELSEQYVWNGAMITGVPNFAICIGYTNASWTLRADLTHRLVTKVLGWMESQGHAAVVARPDADLTPQPLLDLASGYVKRSIGAFPRQGDRRPWQVRQNYMLDSITALRTPLGRSLVPVTGPLTPADESPVAAGVPA
ncbi:flavin-binding monooxygenase [Nocardioides psychrotolerans]|uniref:Predicted flavoprotein CzcO associated with the cation diffusion facilitator CzcD n=1 Tax=Nocardioides psychrotolerans TaxID=1005945 RepID=A0A1I3RBW5_9ACTN|nr:NAD(P)/FAD-dependent oxidoreductase [Nocardioides psychrotolerans]GEP40429.1 flavin-binding monooxygenase [Nocardioides psychrotolerans]SFJ44063.1 Predicted flavoprotein CzcO associated with the cation diffusion facilitator CzcD [Nocardioides psychrotolerans]